MEGNAWFAKKSLQRSGQQAVNRLLCLGHISAKGRDNMSEFKVVVASGPDSPKSISAALELAEKTGQLAVPAETLCLTVTGGEIEVSNDKE